MASRAQVIARQTTLRHAIDIASTYGGNLTLRQLYYRLVATAIIGNSQQDYKRLGDIITSARLSGEFPLEWLIDRGRTVHEASSARFDVNVATALDQGERALRSFPFWYLDIGRWHDQPTQVSVWVEKDALSGVFEEPCNNLGVGWFACKGYPSVSALHEWMKYARAIEDAMDTVTEHRVLYFGDHDPDGWQIPRSALDNLRTLANVMDAPPRRPIVFERVALNMAQIRAYSPPPFPAKMTSSRYAGYVQEHGTTDAWELDALDPPVLDALIRTTVASYFDEDTHDTNCVHVDEQRADMRRQMRDPDWAADALEGT